MQLFSALPLPGHEILSLLQYRQMLRNRLAGHVEPLAQLAKRLAIPAMQPVQQPPAARIGRSAKHSIVIHAGDMEPFGYPLIWNRLVACQGKNFLSGVTVTLPEALLCTPAPGPAGMTPRDGIDAHNICH